MVDETEAEERPDLEEEEGGPVKPFLDHLEDLRWVIIKSAVALGLAMLICLIAGNHVVGILKYPLRHARTSYPGTNQVLTVLYGTNQVGVFQLTAAQEAELNLGTNRYVAVQVHPKTIGTNNVLSWDVETNSALAQSAEHLRVELMNLSPASGFFVAFQVAFYGGMVMAAPFIFYFIASFVFPALRMRERFYVYRALGFGIGLFVLGLLFCYFALMPLALTASQRYSDWLGFSAFQWKADDYISFVSKFMLGMGIGFEMPIIILTLVKIGVLNYRILSRGRRYMVVINLVLGAVLTTPEVVTQVIMFVPLQLLYEVSIWITWYWERKQRLKEEAEAAAESP